MHSLSRHCERSEAIQSGWPRRLRILAMTLVGFLLTLSSYSGNAFACLESETFSGRLSKATVAFEGRLIRREKHEMLDDGQPYPLIVDVYAVEKNWNGTLKGQEVKANNPLRGFIGKAEIPQNGVMETFSDSLIGVYLFSGKIIQLKDTSESVYVGNACPASYWPLSFGAKVQLAMKFPKAIF